MLINLDYLNDIKGKYLAQDYYNLLIKIVAIKENNGYLILYLRMDGEVI